MSLLSAQKLANRGSAHPGRVGGALAHPMRRTRTAGVAMANAVSHDRNFKNLILDYPHESLAFFAAREARRRTRCASCRCARMSGSGGATGNSTCRCWWSGQTDAGMTRQSAVLLALEEESDGGGSRRTGWRTTAWTSRSCSLARQGVVVGLRRETGIGNSLAWSTRLRRFEKATNCSGGSARLPVLGRSTKLRCNGCLWKRVR